MLENTEGVRKTMKEYSPAMPSKTSGSTNVCMLDDAMKPAHDKGRERDVTSSLVLHSHYTSTNDPSLIKKTNLRIE